MQSWRTACTQLFAQTGDDIEPKGFDRGIVVAIVLQMQADPAWYFSTARIAKAQQLR